MKLEIGRNILNVIKYIHLNTNASVTFHRETLEAFPL